MTRRKRLYAHAMQLRIDHHAPDFLAMWLKLRPELIESDHWILQPRKGLRYEHGISCDFTARNGKTIEFVYRKRLVHFTVDGRTRAFSARQPKAALRYVKSIRAQS
jgi:hypothetical protein